MVEIFKSMKGIWALQRTCSIGAVMQGTVKFSETNEKLLYHYQEESIVYFEDKSYRAHKEYAYSYDINKIMIHLWNKKEDQKADLLHTLEFSNYTHNCWPISSYSVHNCKQDIYRLHFVLVTPEKLQLNYQVQGPHKNYTIQTLLHKR